MSSNTSIELHKFPKYIPLKSEMEMFDDLPLPIRERLNNAVGKWPAADVWKMINIGLPDEQKEQRQKYTVEARIATCLEAIDIRDRMLIERVHKH
jgi:hypothetical protein